MTNTKTLTKAQQRIIAEIAANGDATNRSGSGVGRVMDTLKYRGLIRFEKVGQIWDGPITRDYGKWVVA